MSKDPAVLFYINDWLTSTAEMDSDTRGWYLNLLLHNYDKKDLPNDVEKLAVLCNVKFSEFERFKQVFEQVFKQKFQQTENGRLTNERTTSILRARENFKDKRSNSGKLSYLLKFFEAKFPKEFKNKGIKQFVKDNFDYSIDLKNEQMLKQMLKQMFKLYINENENENNNEEEKEIKTIKHVGIKILNKDIIYPFESENFKSQWELWKEYKSKEHKFKFKTTQSEQAALKQLSELSNNNEQTSIEIIHQSLGNGWKGLFELKNKSNGRPEQSNAEIFTGAVNSDIGRSIKFK